MNRRGFLGAILAAGMAPAVVKASALMPVRPVGSLILPGDKDFSVVIDDDPTTPFTVGGGGDHALDAARYQMYWVGDARTDVFLANGWTYATRDGRNAIARDVPYGQTVWLMEHKG